MRLLGGLLCFLLSAISLSAQGTKNVHFAQTCRESLRQGISKGSHYLKILGHHIFSDRGRGDLLGLHYPEDFAMVKVVELAFKNREQMIFELETLMLAKPDSEHAKILAVGVKKLKDDLQANRHSILSKLDEIPRGMSLARALELRRQYPNLDRLLDNLNGFELRPRATLAETYIALQARSVNALEASISDLFAKAYADLLPGLEKHPAFERAKDLEMDIVSGQYKHWFEVKTISTKHPKRLQRFFESLLVKAQRVSGLTRILSQKLGKKVQFHIVIIGEVEIPVALQMKMQKLGVRLHQDQLNPALLTEY